MPRKKSNADTPEDSEDNVKISTLLKGKKLKKQFEGISSGATPIHPTSGNPEDRESLTSDNEATQITEASVTRQRKKCQTTSVKSVVEKEQTPEHKPPRRRAVSTPKHKKPLTKTSIQFSSTAVPAEKNKRVYLKASGPSSTSKKQRKLDFEAVHDVGLPTIKKEPQGSHNETLAESKDYLPISSLREADREWTLKVKILRKGTVDRYNNDARGPGMYQKYLLQDEKGLIIQATIFNEVIAKLKEQMQRGMTYYLSNGFIKAINKAYANAHDSLEIILGPTTCVEPSDTPLEDAPKSYSFIEFDNLQRHMGSSSAIDTIGFVVRVEPLISFNAANTDDKLYKRDVILSNLRSQNIVFTLWADLATEEGESLANIAASKPVIAISKAKVVDKNGSVSISSLVITTIEIDPKILDSSDMQKWRDFDHPISSSNYIRINLNTPYEELKLNDLITRDFTKFKDSYYCFKGEIISISNENAPWYKACTNCSKKVENESNKCTNCNIGDATVTLRYMLKLNVQDDTRKASITLFDVAEKIIGCPPTEMSSKMDLDAESNEQRINNLKGSTFLFTVRVQKSSDTARKAGRFIAHDVQAIDG